MSKVIDAELRFMRNPCAEIGRETPENPQVLWARRRFPRSAATRENMELWDKALLRFHMVTCSRVAVPFREFVAARIEHATTNKPEHGEKFNAIY